MNTLAEPSAIQAAQRDWRTLVARFGLANYRIERRHEGGYRISRGDHYSLEVDTLEAALEFADRAGIRPLAAALSR